MKFNFSISIPDSTVERHLYWTQNKALQRPKIKKLDRTLNYGIFHRPIDVAPVYKTLV